MTEQTTQSLSRDNQLFQGLILNFKENSSIMNLGQFFENETENNELYLIHQIQNFLYNKESDSLEVQYICEQLHNDERDTYSNEERNSLLNPKERFLLYIDIEYDKLKRDNIQAKDLYQTIIYQGDSESQKNIAFIIREIEHLEFVNNINDEHEEDIDSPSETYLRIHLVVDPLFPIPENEREQILNILRKSKFNIVQQ